MSNYNFYPGQRVVCVNDAVIPAYDHNSPILVQAGVVYTINTIWDNYPDGTVAFWLDELADRDGAYVSTRFRPFDELDACIEEIEKMQAPVEVETVEA